jgi:hypothetical protein
MVSVDSFLVHVLVVFVVRVFLELVNSSRVSFRDHFRCIEDVI